MGEVNAVTSVSCPRKRPRACSPRLLSPRADSHVLGERHATEGACRVPPADTCRVTHAEAAKNSGSPSQGTQNLTYLLTTFFFTDL